MRLWNWLGRRTSGRNGTRGGGSGIPWRPILLCLPPNEAQSPWRRKVPRIAADAPVTASMPTRARGRAAGRVRMRTRGTQKHERVMLRHGALFLCAKINWKQPEVAGEGTRSKTMIRLKPEVQPWEVEAGARSACAAAEQ